MSVNVFKNFILNKDMEYVDNRPSYFQTIWTPIASMGWYIVGLVIVLYYTFPLIQKKYKNWKLARNQQDDAAIETDELPQLSANVELARQKMQEAYNKSCILAQVKEEEEKEKKRQKILKLLENKNVGTKLGNAMDNEKPSTSTKSKFKSEYNPLMGDNARGYRPPKRTCCKKGGCG
ncbi:selenoprotein S isoform X2 [Camponotus floridanus]|uniref:selenoprotein S isoform X2 n=1 Tax=Camponotus floridanus TaxID=104421 RepID=UPI00059C031B|nr:selenoprotein S isoform X2 [Camponotus floridanus]